MTKTLVLLSGGLDSATVAWYSQLLGDEIGLVHFNYGQQNKDREMQAAMSLAHELIPNQFSAFFIPYLGVFSYSNSRVMEGEPSASVEDNVVPLRNAVLLSSAVSMAIQLGYDRVGFGAKRSEFPDCQPKFITQLQQALISGNGKPSPTIWTPFINSDRKQMLNYAHLYEVPIELTWSCYTAGPEPCGKCGACLDRASAGI